MRFDVDPESPEPFESPPPESPPLESPERLASASPDPFESPSPEPLDAAAFVFELLALERSFFAQPEPLKWIDGATTAFRSVLSAPHAGQKRGAGASIPWMNSVRVEQVEQT